MVDQIEPPSLRSNGANFEIVVPRTANRLRSGALKGIKLGAAFWRASISIPNLTNDEKDPWRAFFDHINDEGAVALLHDPARPFPKAYSSFAGLLNVNSEPFDDGLAKVFSITNVRKLTVYQLPSLFELKQGDYVEIRRGERKYLHRISADATATAGGVVSIQVRPPMVQTIAPDDVVCFKKAKGEFVINSGSISGMETDISATPISFSATSRAS